MAQFLKLENGNFFSASMIMELRADVNINVNSAEKCKVVVGINILTENGTARTLISGVGEAPWMDSEDVELYKIVCNEREAVERKIRNFFELIARSIICDTLLYFSPSFHMKEELQQIAKDAAQRIVFEAHKRGAGDE